MKTVRYVMIGGIIATIVIGTVGYGNVGRQSPHVCIGSTSLSTKAESTVQFYIPQQLPPKIELRTIKSSPSQIELDYAPVGYSSMVANTFWIQEIPSGHLSSCWVERTGCSSEPGHPTPSTFGQDSVVVTEYSRLTI